MEISDLKLKEAVKQHGVHYTPFGLAYFVALELLRHIPADIWDQDEVILLDPAAGDGILLTTFVGLLNPKQCAKLQVIAIERDPNAIPVLMQNLESLCIARHQISVSDFLEQDDVRIIPQIELFDKPSVAQLPKVHIVIANPPYVRTQVIGSQRARYLSTRYGLDGRVDLYAVFIAGILECLAENGTAALITSNRFLSTKAGASVRRLFAEKSNVRRLVDLGDSKLFTAAVLPAVTIVSSQLTHEQIRYTSVYETKAQPSSAVGDIFEAIDRDGVFALPDGRNFEIKQGHLDRSSTAATWQMIDKHSDAWDVALKRTTWKYFGDVGSVHVGIKTTADKVFIDGDWQNEEPELLRPLTTHRVARRFSPKSQANSSFVIYPHEMRNGKRTAVNLNKYPRAAAYFERHRNRLQKRTYIETSNRQWYEIWVPHSPDGWQRQKLVFRDIAVRPTFWVDLDGTVVNGDCYWISVNNDDPELIWLMLGVANSTFIEAYYDRRFSNKLYSGRRRFMTQYVEQFPLPDPKSVAGREIIRYARIAYNETCLYGNSDREATLDELVWAGFGLEHLRKTFQG